MAFWLFYCNDEDLLASCIGGTAMKEEYVRMLHAAGFKISILFEDKENCVRQYGRLPLENIKLVTTK